MSTSSGTLTPGGVPSNEHGEVFAGSAATMLFALPPVDALTDCPDTATAFSLHARCIWRVLKRLGVASDSLADATQDVFIVAHRRWQTFEARSSRRGWLIGIAVRVAKSHRHKQRHPMHRLASHDDEIASLPAKNQSSPFEHTAQQQAGRSLQSLIDTLPPTQKALIILVYLEELSIAEAAQSIGLIPRRAYTELNNARQALARSHRQLQLLEPGAR